MGDEDEDPDEVMSEPREVEGDFIARCSSGLTENRETVTSFSEFFLCVNLIPKIDKGFWGFFLM